MEECKGKKKKRKDFQRNSLFGKDLKSNTLHQDCIFKGMLHLMYQNEIECYIFVVDCLLTSSEVWKITVLKAFFSYSQSANIYSLGGAFDHLKELM